jgi:hypothetical protein
MIRAVGLVGIVMRSILAVGLLGLLVGCGASGLKVSEQQTESLGPPTSTTVNADGTRIAAYSYASMRSQPQYFIPHLGPLVTGSDHESGFVTFDFDQRGVLTGTTSSQPGMAAGAKLDAAPYEAALRPSLPGERQ